MSSREWGGVGSRAWASTRSGRVLLALIAALGAMAALASAAGATQYQRPLIGTFGSAAEPAFELSGPIAVDPTTDDVLVGEGTTPTSGVGRINRFTPDGTPDPFSALGTNVIDGELGPGGKPCAEEPASCDETPQGRILVSFPGAGEAQFAVDPTTGNIYLTQIETPLSASLVDIFSPDGRYLGQLTAAGTKSFTNTFTPCGVAVDRTGAVYVAASNQISKFVPSADPPLNTDDIADFSTKGFGSACRMALGTGPSAGSIFVANRGGQFPGPRILKVDKETGEVSEFVKGDAHLVTVDPTTGNPVVFESSSQSDGIAHFAEFDGSVGSTSEVLSRMIVEVPELGSVSDIASDAAGNVYVAYTRLGRPPTSIRIYGHPAIVPTVTVGPAEEITADGAILSGTVEADGLEVEECFFEWGRSFPNGQPNWTNATRTPCEETVPADSEAHEAHAKIAGLEPNGVPYNFRLAAKNANGTERTESESFVTARTVETKQATVTGKTGATLHGAVRPEGSPYTECVFEWGPTTSFGYEHTEACQPEAGEIPADSSIHAVSLPLTGLKEATEYRFRLKATNGEGTIEGSTLTFQTFGPPQIIAVGAIGATTNTVSLEGRINPGGFATTYHFDWGTNGRYEHTIPGKTLDASQEAVRVSAVLGGLSTETAYSYRLVAESSAGKTESSDQVAETLNSCGLPEGRCFELVSRRDPGPVAIPGQSGEPIELYFQAATSGTGGLAYAVESGYPDANTGYSVLYRGLRQADGWRSNPVRPSVSGGTQWLSNDLSCGFLNSGTALTDDPGPRLASSLYRFNPDGTFTAVPRFAPEASSGGGGFQTAGASQGCHKVVFSSTYRYHGIPGVGSKRLYEWDEGKLRNVGVVPGPGGEVAVEAKAASFNAVSEDGSRVFFTAARQSSPNAEEIGKQAIFVREAGAKTRDLSLSETSVPDIGAAFQWATPDGSKVFFLANYGLTSDSSAGPTTSECASTAVSSADDFCDLYEYDLEAEKLTDLSTDHESGGAEVGGFVGASVDGSHAYFAARGQFLPAYGRTKAENISDDTYSLYGVTGGKVSFVGTVQGGFGELRQLATPGDRAWSSNVSPDGRYLLFQTSTNVTAYDSGGVLEAYLYDSEKGSGGTICISCRPDGKPSVASSAEIYSVLGSGGLINNPLHPPQFLSVGKDGPRVFFFSLDGLTPGAVDGQDNVYEWSHGQLFHLAGIRASRESTAASGGFAAFVGASADGSDAYLVSPERLNWEDPDERLSVYDARIGGGFQEPPPAPQPCDPSSEGSCRSAGQVAPAGSPGAASATYVGPGNVKAKRVKKHRRRRGHHHRMYRQKAHGKKAKHRKNKHGNGKRKHRRAHQDRRAGR